MILHGGESHSCSQYLSSEDLHTVTGSWDHTFLFCCLSAGYGPGLRLQTEVCKPYGLWLRVATR